MKENTYKIECTSEETCNPNGWFVQKILNYKGHVFISDTEATIYTKDSIEKVEEDFKKLEPSPCCVRIVPVENGGI
jgi:hypothetical protein